MTLEEVQKVFTEAGVPKELQFELHSGRHLKVWIQYADPAEPTKVARTYAKVILLTSAADTVWVRKWSERKVADCNERAFADGLIPLDRCQAGAPA